MSKEQFSIKSRLNSFKYAWKGIRILIKKEHNSRIHLFAAILVIIFSFIMEIHTYEWLAILICIALVIISEVFNTALEHLCDFVSPTQHEAIGKIKDLSAAAVLISSILALLVACLVFIPKFLG